MRSFKSQRDSSQFCNNIVQKNQSNHVLHVAGLRRDTSPEGVVVPDDVALLGTGEGFLGRVHFEDELCRLSLGPTVVIIRAVVYERVSQLSPETEPTTIDSTDYAR
jgi:hypothetical protein